MSLAQFSDVTFGYPGTEILGGASLLIRPGDRIALLGPNGTGKSTALRLLAGDLQADAGDVRVLGRATVAYLRQSQEFAGAGTLMDALLEPFAALQTLHDEMTAIEHRLGEASPAEVHRYGELQERYLREGGYDLESRVRRLTADVGFSETDLGRSVSTLSGGERGRLELAKVLVRQPDLLLLDEPTNHLDLAAIERLEAFLSDYPGAFVLVSHDRAFIRAVCREVVELESGKFVRYPFGYDKYVVERDARLERARVEYERQKEHVDKTEDFIRRNLAGQKTKQAQSRRKMLEKLDRLERPEDHWQFAGKIGLNFSAGDDLGSKETIRAPHITVGYPDAPSGPILRDVTVNIYRGDKVGIVGPNGAGKSTLLKTLIGQLAPLAGKVETGTGVRIGYFDQKLGTLSEELTLIDEIRTVRADLSPEYVRTYLAKFRFFGDDPFRTVRGLSGGERSRLAMAKIMLFPRKSCCSTSQPTTSTSRRARRWRMPCRPTRGRCWSSATIATSWTGSAPACWCSMAPRWRPTSATTPTGGGAGARRRPRRRPRRLGRWRPRRRSARQRSSPRRRQSRWHPKRRRRRSRRRRAPPTRSANGSAGGSRSAWRHWRRMSGSSKRSCAPCAKD